MVVDAAVVVVEAMVVVVVVMEGPATHEASRRRGSRRGIGADDMAGLACPTVMDHKQQAEETVQALMPGLVETNRWMYENPELGYEEEQTSAHLVGILAGSGFQVEYPAYGLDTAFVARAGSAGPEVVICAEMDALPGVGQACGHNIIATAAMGAGIALAPLAEELGIRVTVLGTPAEEKYGGKVDLLQAGAFSGAAAAMMIHPAPFDAVDPNVIAVARWQVDYFGKTAHASAFPERGINALDAFVQAYVSISTLRQAMLPTDKVHGVISKGGEAANIVPDHTRSEWYVRARTRDRLDQLMAKVRACFEGAAAATGCRLEITPTGHPYTELLSDPLLVEIYAANSAALGRPMLRGADLPPSMAGSTDMGNVSLVVPTIHPMLDIRAGEAVNHQPEFAEATVTAEAEKAIFDGAVSMAWTVIDLAEQGLWDRLTAPNPMPS